MLAFFKTFLLCLLLAFSGLAVAEEIVLQDARLTRADAGALALSADFSVKLSDRLSEAVERGIVLHFVAEFELSRPRWYWADQTLAEKRIDVALSYHAITRQYRLSTGALHQSFPTLAEALQVLGHLRRWPVADAAPLPEKGDEASLRLYLDVSQLPKPFQVMAIGRSDWHLDSGKTVRPYAALLAASPKVSVPVEPPAEAEAPVPAPSADEADMPPAVHEGMPVPPAPPVPSGPGLHAPHAPEASSAPTLPVVVPEGDAP
ncbi:MAG: DUF4390 domain-containing protein [Zoogloeaceae bacterium]|nr:DUF4390 domain-containing protein [Zoogloeaceae bacterium]